MATARQDNETKARDKIMATVTYSPPYPIADTEILINAASGAHTVTKIIAEVLSAPAGATPAAGETFQSRKRRLTFTPSPGGVWTFKVKTILERAHREIDTLTVIVGSRLTRKLSYTGAQPETGPQYAGDATLTLYVWDDDCIATTEDSPAGEQTPALLSPDTARAKIAVADPEVLAATAAMAGATATDIAGSLWTALQSAWNQAIIDPGAVPGTNPGSVTLVSAGWS
jgi:hypothetical protein